MDVMQGVLPALAVVAVAVAASAYLLKVHMPRDESNAGIAALAAMSWREFINLVLEALGRRGYTRVFEQDGARDDSEYILERGGERWLMSCKHGSAFVLGQVTVADMAQVIRLHGLAGGLLLTQGSMSEQARPAAALHRIELLDGPTLWPELREVIAPQLRAQLSDAARQRARQRMALTWATALPVAVALFLVLALGPRDDAPDPVQPVTAVPAPRPAVAATTSPPAAAPAPAPSPVPVPGSATGPGPVAAPGPSPAPARAAAVPAPVPAVPAQSAPADPAAGADRQRAALVSAAATLPGVDRALWATRSTLQVFTLSGDYNAKAELCPLVLRYPDLAASRIQLTPPAGSGLPVRFLQCRAY